MKINTAIEYMHMVNKSEDVKYIYDEVDQALYTLYKWGVISGGVYNKHREELLRAAMDIIEQKK